jgi:hypothetical protein
MGLMGHQGLKETLESLDRRVTRVFKEKLVYRAHRANQGHKETKV